MWAKFKSLPVISTIVLVLSAVVFAMAGVKISRLEKRAEKKTQKSVDKLNSGVSTYIHQGKKLAESANKDLDKAVEIKKLNEKRLEALGEQNDSLDDIAHRFNSKRVRLKQSSPST
jgi:uncharacterized protein YoxC